MDNLESQTYEVFEKDPIKYTQYQKAVYYALLDRVADEDKETSVMYERTRYIAINVYFAQIKTQNWCLQVR